MKREKTETSVFYCSQTSCVSSKSSKSNNPECQKRQHSEDQAHIGDQGPGFLSLLCQIIVQQECRLLSKKHWNVTFKV